jgi:Tetracyclin repressor-like, C-terminal domain
MRKSMDTPLPWQYEKIVRSSAFGHLLEAVTAAIESGRLEGDPMLVSISLWVAVHGITSLLISKPGFPWPETELLIDEVIHRALYGAVPRR